MKTLILITLLLCSINIDAQNYYSSTKVFNENGYSYQCEVKPSKIIMLYNRDYKLLDSNPIVKSTGEVFTKYETTDLTDFRSWVSPKIEEIVNKAFSPSQKQLVKGVTFFTTMCINTTTGKVDEVFFEFYYKDPYVSIPISVFRQIEVEIKKNIWFVITEDGKKLNFIASDRECEPY